MKKILSTLLLCAIALAAVSCTASGDNPPETAVTEPMAVDLDLSVLSGTVVYAQENRQYNQEIRFGAGVRGQIGKSSDWGSSETLNLTYAHYNLHGVGIRTGVEFMPQNMHVDYYIGELWNNNDYPITAAYYFIDATYAGLSLYNEKFACTQAHRNDYTPCVELLAACMADGPRSGEVDCYDTAACELNCLSSGCDCLNTDKASYEGILHYMEVYYCLYTHGCEADDAECAHEHCAEYLDACYEKASCDVISNGCPDGQACAISSYRDPVCRPAGDKQLGDECRMGASDCAAGLVCSPVEDLKEATCVVPCKGEDDCVDGHCVINSLTSAWLGEGVGYCKEGSICIDSDNDGYCAENDCNDGDPSIHPDNKEICGDSIDQNCNGQTDEGCEEDPPADASVDGDVDASDADVNADAESDASDAETSDADAESDASDAETSDAEVDIDASDASDAATEADAASNDATKEDADVSTKNDASSDAIDDDDGGDDGCSAIPGSHSGSFLALLSLPLMMIRRRKRA